MIKRINNEIEKLIKEKKCMNVTATYENVNSKNFVLMVKFRLYF